MGVRVKICGLTSVEDARAAVEAGADMLGFNFYPKSPRYLTPDACSHVVSALRAVFGEKLLKVSLVGVFVNATPEEMLKILGTCGLDLAQLSGDETPECLAAMAGRSYKAMRTNGQGSLAKEAARYRSGADRHAGRPIQIAEPAVLVDAGLPGAYGGTGHLADWQQAKELAGRIPILLAGGLTPENVGAAVAAVRPWGVDVASGVESAPGTKDADKMRRFIQAAKTALPDPSMVNSGA